MSWRARSCPAAIPGNDERRDRRLQLVEDLRAFSAATFSGCSPASRRGFFRRQRPQIEMGRGRQSLVVRETRLQIPFPGRCHVSLAMGGASLVERGDRGLAGICRCRIARGRPQLFRALSNSPLPYQLQSIANRLGRIIGPLIPARDGDQQKGRGDRQRDGPLAAIPPRARRGARVPAP